ncbi:s-adenosylmethionine mitochondrial carrier protein [Holotrichia oblita]|uniref:S-adenosylmethionine mitochondrial carrier protein n=1 Tax=Holotrichia oblita TaxID=644536 RepID=A0ACB9SNQ8_HOLOL|nr:s-adenosylmethionine mitochondrial carrier protein [Holotrichia oblita]
MVEKNLYISSLFGGAAAGLVVDVVLFPLDTIKTRLQSQQGFLKAGGFTGIYKGIGPQVIASAPQAALFFCTYETFKHYASPHASSHFLPIVHMTGASLAEIVACFIRVPMEVVKQRRQTTKNRSSLSILISAYRNEGFIKGLYRGYGSTIIREVPFSIIQFPVLEYLKTLYKVYLKDNSSLQSWEVANCGAIAGGIAAAVTTPLDVVKTRIMLADKTLAATGVLTVRNMMKVVYKEKGMTGLFAGFTPRVMWITIGGYIFFGVYDFAKNFCNNEILGNEYDFR